MPEIPLSEGTRQRLDLLFAPSDRARAETELVERCSGDRDGTPESRERLRYAVLRLSHGDLERLRDALDLHDTDYRDLLMAADFGTSVDAHLAWMPRRIGDFVGDWIAGRRVEGVQFRRGDRVRVSVATIEKHAGKVLALVAVEPEPVYLIAFDHGPQLEIHQAVMRAAR